jgi:hypothetical protein
MQTALESPVHAEDVHRAVMRGKDIEGPSRIDDRQAGAVGRPSGLSTLASPKKAAAAACRPKRVQVAAVGVDDIDMGGEVTSH